MRKVPARSPATLQLDHDTFASEELIGRLHHATDATILHLVEQFTSLERANLAMFCYRKAHLRRIGLAIAATCDLPSCGDWPAPCGALRIRGRTRPDPRPVGRQSPARHAKGDVRESESVSRAPRRRTTRWGVERRDVRWRASRRREPRSGTPREAPPQTDETCCTVKT